MIQHLFRRRRVAENPRVLTYPRDPNPYQELLHTALAHQGVVATYLPERTPSAAVNLLLLPGELLRARLSGARILHIHWVFKFVPAWARNLPGGRALGYAWFRVVLRCARLLGYRLVWTAHNLLPHAAVFPDDAAARRRLLSVTDRVIVHGQQVGDRLVQELGADPTRIVVIPHGPFAPHPDASTREETRASLGVEAETLLLGLVGRIDPYKGADDLLEAACTAADNGSLPVDARVLVAGSPTGDSLRNRLESLAAGRSWVDLRLGWLSDAEFSSFVGALDLAVLPFHKITTSGSAIAALSAGVPVAVPAALLPDLPDEATLRFESLDELFDELVRHPERLIGAREAARHFASTWTWQDVASHTTATYRSIH